MIDELTIRWGAQLAQYECSSRLGRTSWYGEHACLTLLRTSMNRSSEAAVCLWETNQGQRTDFVVVYDDWDPRLGRLRIKRMGCSGGHGWVASILAARAGSDFARINIENGCRPARFDEADFVLQPFTRDEEAFTLPAAQHAVAAGEAVLAE